MKITLISVLAFVGIALAASPATVRTPSCLKDSQV